MRQTRTGSRPSRLKRDPCASDTEWTPVEYRPGGEESQYRVARQPSRTSEKPRASSICERTCMHFNAAPVNASIFVCESRFALTTSFSAFSNACTQRNQIRENVSGIYDISHLYIVGHDNDNEGEEGVTRSTMEKRRARCLTSACPSCRRWSVRYSRDLSKSRRSDPPAPSPRRERRNVQIVINECRTHAR